MYKRLMAIISTIALVLLLGVGTVSAAIRTVTLRVKGMTCGGCATSVEKALKSTEGVQNVRVSFERGKAVIKYDDQRVTVDKLREVIQSTGFFCDLK
jgi:copper chaperone